MQNQLNIFDFSYKNNFSAERRKFVSIGERTVFFRKPSGFTLVELLVVIAIIALLLAILMPTLSKARENGRAAVCGSNLKQMGLIWTMYAEENRQQLYIDDIQGYAWCWWFYVIAYEKGSSKVLACPSMYRYGCFDNYETGFYPGDYRGYGRIGSPVGWVNIGYGYNMRVVTGHNKITDFRAPSRTGLMAEIADFYWYNISWGISYNGQYFADRHINGKYKFNNSGILLKTLRPGKAKVLFMDGHVDWEKTPFTNSKKPPDLLDPLQR